jgi:metallophosphoesterase superfamily enzyme
MKYKQLLIKADLHTQVKSHCAIHGISMVAFVEAALINHLGNKPLSNGDQK